MPPFLARTHDSILKSFIERGESKYIKASKITFAKKLNGFIMPIKLYLDFAYLEDTDFQLYGTLLKVNSPYDYVLFHQSG